MVAMLPLPHIDGGFKTILADPPWSYEQRAAGPHGRGAAKHYACMSVDEIKEMPIRELSSDDSICLLWVTNSHLPEGFGVLISWGFDYKTCATWIKNRMGLGYWLRGKTEHLLIGVKGNPRPSYIGHTTLSTLVLDDTYVLSGDVTEHSRKPDSSYELAESIGQPPRLELFARRARKGWTQWGLEAPTEIQ